jgi:hypothetical protein
MVPAYLYFDAEGFSQSVAPTFESHELGQLTLWSSAPNISFGTVYSVSPIIRSPSERTGPGYKHLI